MPAAGGAAYLAINVRVSGNPFQFLVYEKEHWGNGLGLVFNTASYQVREAAACLGAGKTNVAVGLWIPGILTLLGTLLLMTIAMRGLYRGYLYWFLVYYLVAMGATRLLSGPRYMAVFFPLAAALGICARKRCVCIGMMAALIGYYGVYLYAFAERWQVW